VQHHGYQRPCVTEANLNGDRPWDVTHPIYQTELLELDPRRHELVSDGHQRILIAEHEFSRSERNQPLGIGLCRQQVHTHSGEEGHVIHNVSDTLQHKMTIV
jgi:hypothetical protein